MSSRSGQGVYTDYSATPLNSVTWVPIIESTSLTVTSMAIFDSSGDYIEVGICPTSASANAEVAQFIIPPGGIDVKINIPANYRVSLRSKVSASITGGINVANVLY